MSRLKKTKTHREIERLAKAHGYTVGRTSGSHLELSREGYPTLHFGTTPSDYRAIRNLRGQMRRATPHPTKELTDA